MLTREQIKNRLSQFLKNKYEKTKKPDSFSSIVNFGLHEIIDVGGSIFKEELRELGFQNRQQEFITIIREIISEWEINGLLYRGRPELDPSNEASYFVLTQYGKECITEDNLLPYDPEGYLQEFKKIVPQIDDISFKYISESIHAYNRRMLLSATVTLGVASENMMLQLIEVFVNAIEDTGRNSKVLSKLEDRGVAGKYAVLREEIRISIKKIPEEFTKELDTYLEGIFSFIRLNRNTAGHPTGRDLSIKVLNANLQILPEYSAYIFNFIDFLKEHKV